jgi:hypothetical protein
MFHSYSCATILRRGTETLHDGSVWTDGRTHLFRAGSWQLCAVVVDDDDDEAVCVSAGLESFSPP